MKRTSRVRLGDDGQDRERLVTDCYTLSMASNLHYDSSLFVMQGERMGK